MFTYVLRVKYYTVNKKEDIREFTKTIRLALSVQIGIYVQKERNVSEVTKVF